MIRITTLSSPFLLSLLVVACTETPPGEQGEERGGIVARVGEESIDRRAVEEFATSLLPGLRSEQEGDDARRDYLQTLIDEKLLVLEARARDLDSATRADFEYAFRKHVVDEYEKRHLHPLVEITEEEVRERLARDGHDRERLLNWLVVETEEEAIRIRERLEQGADFAELARLHSIDERNAAAGGEVGFFDGSVVRMGIPIQLFRELESGEISEPLQSGDAYLLVRFTEERETNVRKHLRKAHSAIGKEKLAVQRRALVEELAYESDLSIRPEGLAILVGKTPGGTSRPQFTPDELATVLYTYEGGEVTVGDYDTAFRQVGRMPGLGDHITVGKMAQTWVLPDIMLWEAALKLGYHESLSALKWKKREEVETLLMAFRRTAVQKQVEIGEEEARQFYLAHPDMFIESTQLWIQEILVDDLDQATALRQRVESGEQFDELVHLSKRQGAEDGHLHLHARRRGRYGDLVDEALAAEIGQLVGPVEVTEGYSVFRVLERSGGELQPFSEVERRATASVRLHKEEELFNRLVADAREKYADQVQIFDRELSAVRLPVDDAYVRRQEATRDSLHDLALAHAADADFEAAYAELESALRVEGVGSAYTHRLLAFIHSNRGQYDEAEKALWQAIEADSSGAEPLHELAVLYNKQGRPEEAENSLMRALRLNPAYKEAWNELGGLYTEAGRHDEADRALKRALEIDSNYAEAYYNLSQLLSAQGQAEEATAMLRRFEGLSSSPTR
jgi:tetratricopeptide (TPR) repeat protein